MLTIGFLDEMAGNAQRETRGWRCRNVVINYGNCDVTDLGNITELPKR